MVCHQTSGDEIYNAISQWRVFRVSTCNLCEGITSLRTCSFQRHSSLVALRNVLHRLALATGRVQHRPSQL